MSTLHFVGLVECDSGLEGDAYKAVARADCLKLKDGYLAKAQVFTATFTAGEERSALAAAIEGAASAAMAWCERENIGGLMQ